MQIKVNGEPREFAGPMTVMQLVIQLELNLSRVAIERNQQIVPRNTYDTASIQEGDAIEIVQFIGGG